MPVIIDNLRRSRKKAALFLVLLASAGLLAAQEAKAQFVDSRISATYKIRYNGMGLGKLHFSSAIKGGKYVMETNTKLKVPLLGSIFKSLAWRGVSKTTGRVVRNQPRPNKYHFSFRNNKKHGTIDMNFAGNRVTHVARVPDKKLSAANVPVQKAHLKGVMDPMSALMLISRKGNSHRSACQRTIPIYDGKQRFDLKLSYKRSVRVSRSQSGGYSGPVIVCRARYRPISGYKPHKKDVKFMIKNRGIELWLMPLPKSRNYAPYQFVLPLPVGTAKAYLTNFNIRKANGRQIALVR